MQRPEKLSVMLSAIALSVLSLHGCVSMPNHVPAHGLTDCHSCHAPGGASGARDFSVIYANPLSHHPVSIKYPAGPDGKPGFNPPNGNGNGIAFFDRDGNGQPDDDEIRLFGASGAATIECASCHKEHGSMPITAGATRNPYLRFNNTGSALCTTCHSY